MRALFNCTINVVGGAVQNAANFVRHAMDDPRLEWTFAVSPQVNAVLEGWAARPPRLHVFETPARNPAARRALRRLASEAAAELAYTMAGPAYLRFPCTHVLGISVPYLTHAGWEGFRTGRTLRSSLGAFLAAVAKGLLARREADFWVFQTETSRAGFARRFHVPDGRSFVIPNAVGRDFAATPVHAGRAVEGKEGARVIFCPAADYPHKNLAIIPAVARALVEAGVEGFEFVLTVPPEGPTWSRIREETRHSGLDRYVRNIGPFSYVEAPRLYDRAAVVFVPSVLEVFSTSYLEALAFGLPLVAADRPFAREICGTDAYYFDPGSPTAAAAALATALTAPRDPAVAAARRQDILERYGDYDRRYERIMTMLETVGAREALRS